MFTYRKDLAREHWHRPWPIRVFLVLLALILILAGFVGWALETEYGGDSERPEYVIGQEPDGAFVLGENGEVVYEATDIADAEAWVGSQRGSRNFTVPILLYVGGALSLILGVSPSPLRREAEPATPTHLVART